VEAVVLHAVLKGDAMKWRKIDEARMLAKVLSREYRRPKRDDKVIDDLIDQIKTLVPEDQGALIKTKRGWRVKLWSGSPRDRKPEQPAKNGRTRRKAA
jgi:hypothetical protein